MLKWSLLVLDTFAVDERWYSQVPSSATSPVKLSMQPALLSVERNAVVEVGANDTGAGNEAALGPEVVG